MQELNYQDLVAGYYENLNNNLRNFKGGPGFLETWVHDEDHNRSLVEILDLAHEHGIPALSIQLTTEISETLNLDWLQNEASRYGTVALNESVLSFVNNKTTKDVTTKPAGISNAYAEKLANYSSHFEGSLELKNCQKLTAVEGGGQISLALNDSGLVLEARHQGFSGVEQSLIDAFCDVLRNRPLQEGADHGTLRLEALLRDHSVTPPVKGLLNPDVADPLFALPQRLARKLWSEFLSSHKGEMGRNFWRDPIPSAWKDLPYEDKLKSAQSHVRTGCTELQLQEDVVVVKILNDTRFVLSFVQDKNKPDFGRNMIKLERWLRSRMPFEVELQLESLEDRNKRVERTRRN